MHIENFRHYDLYQRSNDLMLSIYRIIDSQRLDPSYKEARRIHQIAIHIPRFIASGIGQSYMKVRFQKLNKVKDLLLELRNLLNAYSVEVDKETSYLLNDIEDNSTQVMKLLNGYFGWQKGNKRV